MEKITFITVERTIDELVPTAYNPRILTKNQYDELEKSIKKFGLAELPVINMETNQILAGHMRLQVLTDLYGRNHIVEVRMPTRVLTKEECDEYLIRSNKNTGEWDWDKLKNGFTFNELQSYGFESYELSFFDGEQVDNSEHLVQSMDSFLNGNARQITLYFGLQEYEKIVARMEKVLEKLGIQSYTEAFIVMLNAYKKNG